MQNDKPRLNGGKLHHSFGFALSGIVHAFVENRNLRIHMIMGIAAFVLSYLLGITRIEKLIILLVILLVIASEMINTALEEMTDLITNEHRQEAKAAKDVAAGMVLVAAVGAVIVGAVIFFPYIF